MRAPSATAPDRAAANDQRAVRISIHLIALTGNAGRPTVPSNRAKLRRVREAGLEPRSGLTIDHRHVVPRPSPRTGRWPCRSHRCRALRHALSLPALQLFFAARRRFARPSAAPGPTEVLTTAGLAPPVTIMMKSPTCFHQKRWNSAAGGRKPERGRVAACHPCGTAMEDR